MATLLDNQPSALIEPWEPALQKGIRLYLEQVALAHGVISPAHVKDTPQRVVRAFAEYFAGCTVDASACLTTEFAEGSYDEMIHKIVPFISRCSHHLEAIVGKAHFAYIPNGRIIGLSKISRFIQVLAKRPQVQENLTSQIVDVFQNTFKPAGCAVSIRAYHFCVIARGVNEHPSPMETTALRGVLKDRLETRQEFLQTINRMEPIFP